MSKITYSEIFHSFQGEGFFTGRSTAWIRLFLCNLKCNGFGQEDPTNPDTYILPFEDFDTSTISKIEELPVWDKGCDSSYTWSKKFKHLMLQESPSQIVDKLEDSLRHPSNPNGLFVHPLTHQKHHMAFTGGEPMLKQNQRAIVAIMEEFIKRDNIPHHVTIETNGTTPITDDLCELIDSYRFGFHPDIDKNFAGDWFWSVSPKLWSTSGEKPKKAICPDVVGEYAEFGGGQLKYVINGTQESWDEVEHNTELFRKAGVDWDVYIMAVGATKEEQEDKNIANIAMEAMKRGYHFSARVHCSVFGNQVGT